MQPNDNETTIRPATYRLARRLLLLLAGALAVLALWHCGAVTFHA